MNASLAWMDDAACAGYPERFDMATLMYDEDAAKETCAGCPTVEACRAYSDGHEHGQGFPGYADMVVAGETPNERWKRRTGAPQTRASAARTSERIRALGEPDPWANVRKHVAPWQERGGIRGTDPRRLTGADKGFGIVQVQLMTGLTRRQIDYLSKKGVGPAPPGRHGSDRRWTVAHVDRLRFLKDRLDEGKSMQRARAETLAVSA